MTLAVIPEWPPSRGVHVSDVMPAFDAVPAEPGVPPSAAARAS